MLFSLYNNKTEVFTNLFEAETSDDATRMFMELLNSPKPNQITQYIDEFILYQLGDFDKTTGEFKLPKAPISIINGLELIKLWKARKKMLSELYADYEKGDSFESREQDADIAESVNNN